MIKDWQTVPARIEADVVRQVGPIFIMIRPSSGPYTGVDYYVTGSSGAERLFEAHCDTMDNAKLVALLNAEDVLKDTLASVKEELAEMRDAFFA